MERKSFGQYILIDLLWHDTGQLWRALDQSNGGREVSLKFYEVNDESSWRFYLRERDALHGMEHECVHRLLDYGAIEGRPFLVFEPLEGRFLRDELRAKNGGLSLDEALPILSDILHGLAYIHSKSIAHCHLKPDNIFVTETGCTKLTDFSCARHEQRTQEANSDSEVKEIIGTPAYLAPEQWRDAQVDPRTDLYIFGLLLYELFTCEQPFKAQTVAEIASAQLNGEPPSLLKARPDLPHDIEALYRRLLAKHKEERYQTAAQVESDLLAITQPSALVALQRADETHFRQDFHVQPIWEEDGSEENSDSGEIHSPPSMHWSAIATMAVFGDKPKRKGSPPVDSPTLAPTLAAARMDQSEAAGPITETAPSVEADSSSGRRSHLLSPGMKLLGRYRIIRHLGAGGFAYIYLAFDELLDEEIAVKVPFHGEAHPMAKVFKSQLKAWKFLSDKDPSRVVRLFNAEQVQSREFDAFCIFMEYMQGGSLATMVAREWNGCPRSPDELQKLMRLFLQVCRAVRFLHAHKALHRDIKPANILLDAAHTTCKLSDFELIDHRKDGVRSQSILGGTPAYMAPECAEDQFSEASDIYALGVTLYQLLSGTMPFQVGNFYDTRRAQPQELTMLNPLVSPELQRVVMRCLELNPEHRPQGVDDLISDLAYIGISDEEASAAPVNLARLLLTHLNDQEKEFLTKSLMEDQGFHSARKETSEWQADLIQEYCYTASPRDVLSDNFTSRQLAMIAGSMALKATAGKTREEIISKILEAIGFLPGQQEIPGIETTRSDLEGQLMELAHTTNSDECSSRAISGLAAVERTVDWLVGFYGQLFYGSGFNTFLSRQIQSKGKPTHLMSFGEKVRALRALCSHQPPLPLPNRIQQIFEWPILSPKLFNQLDTLVTRRNELAHRMERRGFYDAQRSARQVLSAAVEVMVELAGNDFIPRIVQIISRRDDEYGRHFYLGRDDRGHSERIFTPLPLNVGRLYLFYPLTNPARINPLIFPYDTLKQDDEASGKTASDRDARKN